MSERETTATSVLTIEVIHDYHDPIAAYSGPRDIRFSWQGIDYRRGRIRQGEPEQFYSFTRLDDDPAHVRLELFGRVEEDLRTYEHLAAPLPPLHRFVFLLAKHPRDNQPWSRVSWQDPELVEHEVLT